MNGERPTQDDPPAGAPKKPQRRAQAPARGRRAHVVGDLLLIFGAFVLASALAGALGAANLGTALSFGQIGLALMTVYVLLRR
jgi:Flp pilus assembly protein TadB